MLDALAFAVVLSASPLTPTPTDHPPEVRKVTASIVTLSDSYTYDRFFDAIRAAVGEDVAVEVSDEAGRATHEDIASGFVIDADGHVATTASFASRGGKLRAMMANGETDEVAIVGFDAANDIAILRLSRLRPPPVRLATTAESLAPGKTVCIVGAGPGTECAVSEGHVRQVRLNLGAGRLHDYLYINTEVAPGAAGAAVVAADGTVIGMVSLHMIERGTLALPAPTIVHISRAIIESRTLPRPTLGVTVFTPAIPMAQERGVHIGGVVPDGPAARAGIQPGDVILEFDGTTTDDVTTLKNLVRGSQPDTEVSLVFRRGTERLNARARLVAESTPPGSGRIVVRIATTYLGLEVEGDTARPGPGVPVRAVDAGSPADLAGVRKGDVLTSVGGEPASDANTIHRVVSERSPGDPVVLEVARGEQTLVLTATLTARTRIATLPQEHYLTEADEPLDRGEPNSREVDNMLKTVRQGIDRYRQGVRPR